MHSRVTRAALAAVPIVAGAVWLLLPYVDAAAFIVRAADLTDGLPGRVAAARAYATTRVDLPCRRRRFLACCDRAQEVRTADAGYHAHPYRRVVLGRR